MSKVPYASDIDCLMYIMVYPRPDLTQVVSQVNNFMSKVIKCHWETIKWIFRYLKGTRGHDFLLNIENNDLSVVGYTDSDYVCERDDKRSTVGYVFTLS